MVLLFQKKMMNNTFPQIYPAPIYYYQQYQTYIETEPMITTQTPSETLNLCCCSVPLPKGSKTFCFLTSAVTASLFIGLVVCYMLVVLSAILGPLIAFVWMDTSK